MSKEQHGIKLLRRAIVALEGADAKKVAALPVTDREKWLLTITRQIDVLCLSRPVVWQKVRFFQDRKGSKLGISPAEFVRALDEMPKKQLELDANIFVHELARELRKLGTLLKTPLPQSAASSSGPAARQSDRRRRD